MTADISTVTDVDQLWTALQAAKRDGDTVRVRAIENRMRDLQGERRFAHLSDEELAARIASLDGNRAPDGMLAHSPVDAGTGDAGIADLMKFNRQIRDQQHVGVEELRALLLDEQARRADAVG